jgi:hypothetical protein
LMAGACGAGPRGEQFKGKWFVNAAGEHLFMESGVDGEGVEEEEERVQMQGLDIRGGQGLSPLSPMRAAFEKMSRRKSWF